MYIWRIPLFCWAAVVSLSLTIFWSGAALYARALATNAAVRAVLLSGAIIGIFLSPFVVAQLTETRLEALARAGNFVDPSPVVYWSPPAAAVVVLGAAHLLFPRRAGRSKPWTWRVAFAVAVLAFITFNVVNWCAPGWCERFGFPLPYSWWSDAIVVINGENVTAGFSRLALAINLACLSFIATTLAFLYRRSTVRP